ncbi:Lipoprotein signal peptidase [Elusimicrobium minutum Pei191]|uniref:Lipoprotein signal peptidase n=1 Tax=Elusimicrobium minutum (strain Pei191) TaxID=445932 RepID=B2KDU9_ELUMP|nr:signal peptidase II [Elusimicrobium minutum]ACC98695.1 Lipoprotein signal peptidase [Elusimicrobium minutum Pei191]
MSNILLKLKNWFILNKKTVIIVLIITGLDRVSKVFTLELLRPLGSIKIFKYFHLTYVENTGMAFGLFQNANLALAVMMCAVIIFLLVSWREIEKLRPPLGWLGLSFILGGAIGNLYDRIFLGYVVDFIDLRVWPVFNIADSFICIGAVLLAAAMLFPGKKETEAK